MGGREGEWRVRVWYELGGGRREFNPVAREEERRRSGVEVVGGSGGAGKRNNGVREWGDTGGRW